MRCMVLFCKNKQSNKPPGVAFFTLTKSRHDPWLQALGRDPNIPMCRGNRVCSDHFLEKDKIYTNSSKRSVRLVDNAIPQLNLGIKSFAPDFVLDAKRMKTKNTSGAEITQPATSLSNQHIEQVKLECIDPLAITVHNSTPTGLLNPVKAELNNRDELSDLPIETSESIEHKHIDPQDIKPEIIGPEDIKYEIIDPDHNDYFLSTNPNLIKVEDVKTEDTDMKNGALKIEPIEDLVEDLR